MCALLFDPARLDEREPVGPVAQGDRRAVQIPHHQRVLVRQPDALRGRERGEEVRQSVRLGVGGGSARPAIDPLAQEASATVRGSSER